MLAVTKFSVSAIEFPAGFLIGLPHTRYPPATLLFALFGNSFPTQVLRRSKAAFTAK